MEAKNYKEGLVAYFDILGFSQVADIKSDEEFMRIVELVVRRNLVNIPQIQKTIVEKSRGPSFHSIDSCSFADSILLWYEISPTELETYYCHIFFQLCGALMKQYFNEGLPLRGAISSGKFYIEDHCFVGKPIVECHNLAKETQWAGCVVAPGASKRLEELWSGPQFEYGTIMQQDCLRYETPVKKEIPGLNPALVIKWSYYDLWHSSADSVSGIADAVRASFTSHGKKIPPEAELKTANTVQFLTCVDNLYANSNAPRDKSLT